MKLKQLLLIALFCFFGSLHADDAKEDEAMWVSAYNADFSITHKLVLTRKIDGVSNELLNQFVMAYLYYRMDSHDEIVRVFEGIDRYINQYLILKED